MLSGLPAPGQSQKVSLGVGRGLPVGSEAGGEGKIFNLLAPPVV